MRVAFVIPRYGADVVGGAEQLCRGVAERLGRRWEIDVVTTCARDHTTWLDVYPPGADRSGPVRVLRFPVERPRDPARFLALCTKIFGRAHHVEDERRWLQAQGPGSAGILDHLRRYGASYDAVVFFIYLYAPTVDGLMLVRDRAALLPTAHDEPMIHLEIFREVFRRPRALLLLTPEEQLFVNTTFGTGDVPQEVVGYGLDPAPPTDAARFHARHAQRLHGADVVLAAGRIERAKGFPELFADFLRIRRAEPSRRLKLVVTGPAAMPIPDSPDIVHLGVVAPEELADAFAAARAVFVPSAYESLSLVALQAWQFGVPVVASGKSAVLRAQCRRSNGGLWYDTRAELREILRVLLDDPGLRDALGEAGRRWVEEEYRWPVVEARWQRVVEKIVAGRGASAREAVG